MPFVDRVRADEANPGVADRLRAYEDAHGRRPVLWELLATHPPLLQAQAIFTSAPSRRGRSTAN